MNGNMEVLFECHVSYIDLARGKQLDLIVNLVQKMWAIHAQYIFFLWTTQY